MKYGICPISLAPLRLQAADASEMVSQVLYGELFKVIEHRKKWSRIRLHLDGYEGWIDNKQYQEIDSIDYHKLIDDNFAFAKDPISIVTHSDETLSTLTIGAQVSSAAYFQDSVANQQSIDEEDIAKSNLINTALLFLNAPYLWGGKSPLGVDCSGFTQLVYRLNDFHLKRDASEQATQGEVLSFIEESEPGDLAFFDNADGDITHVGIIMQDNHIIHAHGKVRIDRLDQSGIYNAQLNTHTHKLRVIKKMI
ncbi:C40 family peptidase [Nonlabens ponticola]|uniref:Hydrolase Nlp/P60 n=1 Tax=Nonlabens ponticola TaxID=2496866 RepID=A0A3S9MZD9_9FLAO|nr:C40 family peptidase [Nonlabens ponticola]AZQ44636.1 hydrolase Nlp/P60 [Nonlabens ponticola]